MHKKPDAYIIGAGTKGITIEQLQNFGIVDSSYTDDKPISIQAAYTDVGWFKRCCDIRARALASMPWVIYRAGSEEPTWSNSEEAPKEFEWLDLEDYLFRADVSLVLAGAAYSLIENPKNLFWFDPTTIEPVYTAQGIQTYKRQVNSRTIHIPAEIMLAIFQVDIFKEQGPGSPDGAATKAAAQILKDLSGYTSDQLRSGLVKKTVFTTTETRPPVEAERKRIKAWLQRFLMGPKATPPEILTGGIQPMEIGASLDELHDNAISQDAKESIASSLGVPHSMVMSNAANFATAKADQLNFYLTTVIPQSKIIANAINRQLLGPMGYRLRFEEKRLEVMQSYRLEQAEAVKELTGIPPMLFNEGRQMLELPELTPQEVDAHIELIQSATGTAGFADTEGSGNDFGKSADIRNWQRVIKRKGRSAKFRPDHLSTHETLVIKERLASGLENKEVFKGPFVGF